MQSHLETKTDPDPTPHVKKNLLDLHYQRYLQYSTTATILLVTYYIGVSIALITEQINFTNPLSVGLLILLSILITGIVGNLLLYFGHHLKNIQSEIRKLNLTTNHINQFQS